MAEYEDIITYLETHDVGDGAMISTYRPGSDKIRTCFLCRCQDTTHHSKVRGKTFTGKIWLFNERLFLAGWEPIACTRDAGGYFTWVKKRSTGFLEAEC